MVYFGDLYLHFLHTYNCVEFVTSLRLVVTLYTVFFAPKFIFDTYPIFN